MVMCSAANVLSMRCKNLSCLLNLEEAPGTGKLKASNLSIDCKLLTGMLGCKIKRSGEKSTEDGNEQDGSGRRLVRPFKQTLL